jgi:hypothetical protein
MLTVKIFLKICCDKLALFNAKTSLKIQFFKQKIFSAAFRPLFPKNGDRTAANFPLQTIFFYGRF